MCLAYETPSRYVLSNCLLDDECARMKQIVGHYLKNSPAGSFTITCDGWKNIKKDPVVNIMIATPRPISIRLWRLEIILILEYTWPLS